MDTISKYALIYIYIYNYIILYSIVLYYIQKRNPSITAAWCTQLSTTSSSASPASRRGTRIISKSLVKRGGRHPLSQNEAVLKLANSGCKWNIHTSRIHLHILRNTEDISCSCFGIAVLFFTHDQITSTCPANVQLEKRDILDIENRDILDILRNIHLWIIGKL